MNRQIHQVTVLVVVLFLVLGVSVTSVQGFAHPALWEFSSPQGNLVTDVRNSRTVYSEFGRDRGDITVANGTIVTSEESDDAYGYQRVYSDGPLYAPVTGYFSTVFASMTGLERAENTVLNGQDPSLFSSRIKSLITGDTQKGGAIELTINPQVQQAAWDALSGRRGSVVALDPSSGAILAMVSSPSYDPTQIASHDGGTAQSAWNSLNEDEGNPMANRAIGGDLYPPGSTFKPAQGAIFLAEGVLTPSTPLSCYGGYPRLGGKPKCHPHGSPISLIPALATSCNAYFCWGMHFLLDDRKRYPSVEVALEHWKERIVRLGYGYRLGVDLPGEKRGYIPNSSVYDKAYKGRWNSSTIISISIGQGEVLATPLQIANLAAIIANRGSYIRPHLVRHISGQRLDTMYTQRQQSGISPEHWEYIVQGMAQAVTGGTCRAANFAPGQIEVCGKTGTAENPHGKDHSAFIGFAPRTRPRIAVSVISSLLMENCLRCSAGTSTTCTDLPA